MLNKSKNKQPKKNETTWQQFGRPRKTCSQTANRCFCRDADFCEELWLLRLRRELWNLRMDMDDGQQMVLTSS